MTTRDCDDQPDQLRIQVSNRRDQQVLKTHVNDSGRQNLRRNHGQIRSVDHTANSTHQCTDEIQVYKEPHGETTDATKFRQDSKLAQVMDGRVDPTTTLREQHTPRDRRHGPSDGIGLELGLERREMLHEERRQEPIFTQREQILLVKRVDIGLSVLVNDTVGDEDRTALVSGTNTVEGEASGETGHGTEQTLESLGEMVGNVVLVNLNVLDGRTR